jgi:putative oxidoreductase
MNVLKTIVGFLGRACLSLIFILSSIQKIIFFNATEQMVTNALCEWMHHLQTVQWAFHFVEDLLHWIPFLVILAILFEGIGGLLVFLGLKLRFGALLLVLLLIPTTLLFHSFWLLQGEQRDLQTIMFLKNLSIFGGLLLVIAFGGKGRTEKSFEPE